MDRCEDRRSFVAKDTVLSVHHLADNERVHCHKPPLALENCPTASPDRGDDLRDELLRVPGNIVCPLTFHARPPGWTRKQDELAPVHLDEQDSRFISAREPRR